MDDNPDEKFFETIINTLAFFDLFDYPLTLTELWQWGLWPEPIAVGQVAELLDYPDIRNRIGNKLGFYFLGGREETVITRLMRYNYANRKYKRLLRVVKLFKIIPWIELAALGNLIGAHNLRDGSDIDVFIVAKKKRVWLTRLCAAGLMAALNLRPKPGKEKDKICLNFYVSEESLDLRNLMFNSQAISQGMTFDIRHSTFDIYFLYWLACLLPVYDRNHTYDKLIAANPWLKEALPNWQPIDAAHRITVNAFRPWLYDEVVDLFCGGLEPLARKFQFRRLPEKIKKILNKDTRVTADDNTIKLHTKDRRREYSEKWREKIKGTNGTELKSENEHILELASVL